MFTVEHLQNDLNLLNGRKEQASQQFYQLVGAISILEQQLNKILNPEHQKDESDKKDDPSDNVAAHDFNVF